MILLKLFLEFIKIGAFSFGGGMGTLPYVYEMVNRTLWIEENAITNILSVSQVTPGPLACNIGTIVGMKVGGIVGAIVANIAFVIPAICFMGISYKLVNKIKNNSKANEIVKIVRAAALAVLITSSLTLFKNAFFYESEIVSLKNILFIINYKSVILGIGLYFVGKYKKIPTLYLMLFSSVIAGIIGV